MTFVPESRTDRLGGKLMFADDPLKRGGVSGMVCAFEEHGLRPAKLLVKTAWKKFSTRTLEQLLAGASSYGVDFAIADETKTGWSASFALRGDSQMPLGCIVKLSIAMSVLDSDERVADIVALARELCAFDQPVYGYLHSAGDFQLAGDPHLTDANASKEVRDAYWLLVLGEGMVDQLGRDRVMSAPAARIESLPQGGALIVTTESPAHVTSTPSRRAQAAVLAHLRPDIPIDQAIARYAERDGQLAPVAKDWDPDLAVLLERICDQVPFSQRQAELARFNGYRAPAVDERRQPPLPADAKGNALERYELNAEQLVALLHDKVAGVSKRSPDLLPEIDFHFWLYDYPRTAERSQIESRLVPAVGAYLGELLVEHLGGTWVARDKLDEAQVVIGDVAWLPFLRARRYLASKQATLDFSLTKFYREVTRQT